MVKEIVQHGHCAVCGRAMKYGEPTCSETCQQTLDRKRRSQKMMMWLMIGAILLIFGLPLLQRALGGA